MSDKDIEQEIQAKGLNAPRVTLGELKANIKHAEICVKAEAFRSLRGALR